MKRYHVLPYHYWLFLHFNASQKVKFFHGARNFAFGLGMVTGATLLIQLGYPAGRALPFTKIAGVNVGLQTNRQLVKQLNNENQKTVKIFAAERQYQQSLDSIGVSILADQTAKKITEYPLSKRLIPFSIFFSAPKSVSYDVEMNQTKVTEFASKIVAENNADPINAVATLNGKTVDITESKNGYRFDVGSIVKVLDSSQVSDSLEIRIPSQTVTPVITTETARRVAGIVDARMNAQLKISANGKTVTVGAEQLKDWVTLTPNVETGDITIGYSHGPIVATLSELANQVYIPAGSNKVIYFDGAEINRTTTAQAGRALVMDASIIAVIDALNGQKSEVQAITADVPAGAAIERGYSRSSKGVQALIDNWVRSNGGNYGIVFKSLDGSGVNASHQQSKQYTSASIYKLYVASLTYQKIGRGELSLASILPNGSTVARCLEVMIVYSDNGCAIALGNTIGWNQNDATLRSQGFSGTTLTSSAHLTTAHDAALWMEGLYRASLIGGSDRESILSYLGRNIYRDGIPAGSRAPVADKVGMLNSYNHDVAIVYHPKGAYILTVMSSGSSLYRVSDLASQISDVMNQ